MDSNILAFEMPGMDVHIHQHAGFQIVFAFEHPFDTEVAGNLYSNIRGFIIRPQLAHSCTRVRGKFAIINIERDSLAGAFVGQLLAKADIRVLLTSADILNMMGITEGSDSPVYTLLSYLRSLQTRETVEHRVKQVIDLIRQQGTGIIAPAELAAAVFLSPSRLSALFKEQTGSSLSKFILWTRLRRAIHMLLTGNKNLSEIAAETGFYDSANFTKYMHEMIGVPPIAFRKNSDLIQVI